MQPTGAEGSWGVGWSDQELVGEDQDMAMALNAGLVPKRLLRGNSGASGHRGRWSQEALAGSCERAKGGKEVSTGCVNEQLLLWATGA